MYSVIIIPIHLKIPQAFRIARFINRNAQYVASIYRKENCFAIGFYRGKKTK